MLKSFFLCVHLRTIDVSNATLTYQIENLPKNQFEICTPGRVYSLQASSREAMFYWLEALQVHVWMLHMTSLRGHPEYTVEINTLLSYVDSFLSPGFGCLLYARAKEQAEELLSHELCQCLQMGGGTPDRKNNLFFFLQCQSKPWSSDHLILPLIYDKACLQFLHSLSIDRLFFPLLT